MKKTILIFALVMLLSFVSGQIVSSDENFYGGRSGTASFVNYGSSFSSYYGSSASTYWPVLSNRDQCTAYQDILVQVTPAGCQPAVVRSDLLAEQNVPVFCPLDLLQINPAIDVKQIRNIRFSGRYPEYVAGVGFHPANAALRTTNQLLGTPLESNIGYVVIVLKRNSDEKTLPEFFNFTLSASIDYYAGNAIGIGATELLLRETNDNEWETAKKRQTLFGGRMSVRVKDTENNDSINVELYSGDVKYSELTLQKGRPQSNAVYLPGSYCQTALQFSYTDLVSPSAIARLKVDEDILDLYEGSRFLNNKCVVRSISQNNIIVNCGSGNINLSSSIEVLNIGEEVYLLDENLKPGTTKYVIKNIIRNESGTFYDLGTTQVSASYIRPVNPAPLYDKSYIGYDDYFMDSIKTYELIADEYGNEKKDLGDNYGEVALTHAIEFSLDIDKKETAARLINKYLDTYAEGKNRDRFVIALNDLYLRDSSSSVTSVEAEDGVHLMRLLDISGIAKKSNAKIIWGTEEKTIESGQSATFNNLGTLRLVRVINSESIDVETNCSNGKSDSFKGTIRYRGNLESACGSSIRVSSVEFEDYVKLRISPVTRNGVISNFTVGVGIEKRLIELTPDKAKKKIERLNESIKKWESISNTLGDVVTDLKTACFATAGVLTVKNFFTGLSGEALARRSAMTGEQGWTKFCHNAVNAGNYSSFTACYDANSELIKNDVTARTNALKQTNNLTEQIEKNSAYPNREGIFAGQSFNDSAAKTALIDRIRKDCSTQISNMNTLFPNGQNVDVYSYSQLRDVYYNCQAIKNGGSPRGNTQASDEINRIGGLITERLEYDQNLKSLNNAATSTALAGFPVDVQGDSKSINGRYFGGKLSNGNFGLTDSKYNNKPAQIVYYNSNPYLAILEDKGGGNIVAEEMYKLKKDGSGFVVDGQDDAVKSKFSKFELRNPSTYNNQFAPGEATVRYFETEPYKGYPAIVPFDLNKGFYAATSQALPIFGGTKSYEGNGNPASFFVCNVMSGGRIDFYAPNYGNDECVQFNIYTGQSFSNFPGLTEAETRRIVGEAIKALKDASSAYGKTSVRIAGNTLSVGRAASLLPGSQCQDYMSPEECKLLFNVCDPVICPTSRCNFGGEYYVGDVVQSGIVGSALLCLPNYKEGIYVPVCLTGIKAGIDGYLSILKSHQQCLQEAVDTGRYVGICDQISSVYLCEFFWRQAAPLAKTVIPKVVEYAYTGGQNNVRGGGEYMTVASSWQNAQDSANYFTQTYAVNSLNAFRVRNVEEAGTELCRAFISAKGPKTFETLVEPDSPPQFHAWYSSIDYTDATLPVTSQYKVFYHIFAGNDRGVSYSVYLKDPPTSSQYANAPIIVVANGFVARGQYATESKDFTAPKGYQQLCVRINDKEECGFKQVSSSFAVNYVSDSIVKDELSRTDITTESSCVSGSLSPAALLNPNLQSAGEEALNPAIYNRGIVRVCATSNPGKGTNEARFVDVGYCGESRLRCWLDKNSIEGSISDSNKGLKEKTLSEIEQIQKANLAEEKRFISTPDLKSRLNAVISKINMEGFDSVGLPAVIVELDNVLNNTFWQKDKAEVLFWKATAYEKVFANSIAKLALNIKGTSSNSEVPKEGVRDDGSCVTDNDCREKYDSGDYLCTNGYCQSRYEPTDEERVVSFDGEYRESARIYLKLNDERTNVFFSNNLIYLDNENRLPPTKLGIVENSGVVSLDSRFGSFEIDKAIDEILGEGSYDLIAQGKLNIPSLKSGVDLNCLAENPPELLQACEVRTSENN